MRTDVRCFLLSCFFITPYFVQGQLVGSIRIERVDSTQIIIQSDTLNQYDPSGKKTGSWIYWSSKEVLFTHKLEHFEGDSNTISYGHISDNLASNTAYFPDIRSIGKYANGKRVGQWLGFTIEGALDWVLYFDSTGKFSLFNKFNSSGQLKLIGSPSKAKGDMVVMRWYNNDGEIYKTEEVPLSYLPE